MYIANCSLGKDSMAMVYLLKKHGYPLDKVYWADMGAWAEFEEIYYFRKEAEKILGISIEPVRSHQWDWNKIFYSYPTRGKVDCIRGFAPTVGPGCRYRSWLKTGPLERVRGKGNTIYIGIALDEAHRAEAKQYELDKDNTYVFPLIELGYTEEDCRKLCLEQHLLNPLYRKFRRLGCWGCPKQSITSLRILRREYPGYWSHLRKMQREYPWPFSASGSMEDLEEKFRIEEENPPEAGTLIFKKKTNFVGFRIPANTRLSIRPDDTPWVNPGLFYLVDLGNDVEIMLPAENIQEIGYCKYKYLEGDVDIEYA